MKHSNLLINKKLYARNFFIFLIFFVIFFSFSYKVSYSNLSFLIIMNLSILLLFLLGVLKPIFGFYVFIFFIPLLNTLTTIIQVRYVPILLLMFFGFFLGFLINHFEQDFKKRLGMYHLRYFFDNELFIPLFLFIVLIAISTAIIIFRYSNFFPFITNAYHNLAVNIKGLDSTSSIYIVRNTFLEVFSGIVLLIVVFNIIKKMREILVAIIILVVSALLSSGMAIYQFFVNPYIGSFKFWVDTGRLNATFTDPNALGAYCILLFPIFISLILYFKKWYMKLIFCVLFLPFIFMTFVSGSRSAVAGILVAFLIFMIIGLVFLSRQLRRLDRRKKIAALISVLTIVFILLSGSLAVFLTDNPVKSSLFETALIQRSVDSLNTFNSYLKSSGFTEALKSISNYRYIFWRQAINMAKEHPLSGVGLGTYIIEVPDYLYKYEPGFVQIDYTGNYYLQVLSELGIPGFILILFVFYLLLKKIYIHFIGLRLDRGKLKSRYEWLFTGLVISFFAMLLAQIFGPHTNFIEVQFTFWLVISLFVVFIKVSEADIKEDIRMKAGEQASEKKLISVSDKIKYFKPFFAISTDMHRRLNIYQKVSLGLIILIFTASFFSASITNLSITGKQNSCYWLNEYGVYKEESIQGRRARWIAPDASTVINEKKGKFLIIPIQDYTPVELDKKNTVKIFVDNLFVERYRLEESNKWYYIKVRIPDFTQSRFTLTIVSSRSWVPKEVGLNYDTKELAAIIGEFEFSNE